MADTCGKQLPDAASFKEKDQFQLDELLSLMAFLRSGQGCPWDREQTHMSLRQNMLEEACEAIDAINDGRPDRLCDELGDVLMQVVFHAQIAAENNQFNFTDVTTAICNKLISRHTHLFGQDRAETAEAVIDNWEKNKRREKGQQRHAQVLEDVPRSLPALMRSYKVQQKAAQVGFDWSDSNGPREKILEELDEVLEETQLARCPEADCGIKGSALESEIGDLLFSVVNYARHLGVSPELALTRSTEKFVRRFSEMEHLAQERRLELAALSLDQQEALWQKAKERSDEA
ncbi:MAG: nucleoside triphosphate pyrophosphohydrolase [Ruminococcaceae bacterium]|jgi:tetrapyrrole methylase family protein/MazG family protein|nr:nucleoside triphosphate pyrophosphohydrolase [Oscillospiraceae bacterium]